MTKCYAPCLLSWFGRILTLLVYAAATYFAVTGCDDVKLEFITVKDEIVHSHEESLTSSYLTKKHEFFPDESLNPVTYIVDSKLEMSSESTQLTVLQFSDRLERCDGCSESWNIQNSLELWYLEFHDWVSQGSCSL